jgi:hypothetical protein
MLSHVFDVLTLSADSLAVGWLIGPWVGPGRRWRLALAFGLCDMVGTVAGQLPGLQEGRLALAAAALAACGGYAMTRRAVTRRAMTGGLLSARPAIIGLLPVLFGFDSLLFPAHTSDVWLLGTVSAALAYCGLLASSASFAGYGHRRAWQAAFVLVPCLLVFF